MVNPRAPAASRSRSPRRGRATSAPATPPADETRDAFRAFVLAWAAFRTTMELYFTQFGISGSQWGILRTLHEAECGGEPRLRQTDLADRLLVRPPSVTSVLDRLERLGLVIRRAAPADRRAKEVSLTPAGRDLCARVLRKHPVQMRAVLGAFDEHEVRTLKDLMQRMSSHLNEMDGGRARPRGTE